MIIVVITVVIVLLVVIGIMICVYRRYYDPVGTKEDCEVPHESLSTSRAGGRPFLSTLLLQDLKTQRLANSVAGLTSTGTAGIPSATMTLQLTGSNSTAYPWPTLRSSELRRTGLGSIDDDGSSITDSSSNILGSIRSEQTLSVADSNVLSTFRSHETTSVDDVVLVSGGRYSAKMTPGDPNEQQPQLRLYHAAVSEEDGGSFYDTPSPKSILREDVVIMRPSMTTTQQHSSSRGLNQAEYFQLARSLNGVRRGAK
ncbi:hypothetical protein AaE_015997 [Aphanomyces astaci]|uniref:Uncharacterized protein n=2 Tax=Aphanomyces astaci TaxID=112090 RepID=A0A6A4YXX6_APHAT|nr:hypothetical protein AaE_015997 [Aphanomyces astaci]